jgi:hypothetical protein
MVGFLDRSKSDPKVQRTLVSVVTRAGLVAATLCVMLALGGCNHSRDNYSNVGPTPPFATPEPPRQTGEPRVPTTERPHRAAGGDILPARADSIPFSRSGGGGTTGPAESVGDAPRQSASLPEPLPEPTATLLPEPPATRPGKTPPPGPTSPPPTGLTPPPPSPAPLVDPPPPEVTK